MDNWVIHPRRRLDTRVQLGTGIGPGLGTACSTVKPSLVRIILGRAGPVRTQRVDAGLFANLSFECVRVHPACLWDSTTEVHYKVLPVDFFIRVISAPMSASDPNSSHIKEWVLDPETEYRFELDPGSSLAIRVGPR